MKYVGIGLFTLPDGGFHRLAPKKLRYFLIDWGYLVLGEHINK